MRGNILRQYLTWSTLLLLLFTLPARAQEAILELVAQSPKPNRKPAVLRKENGQWQRVRLKSGVYAYVRRGETVRLVGVVARIYQPKRSQQAKLDARERDVLFTARPLSVLQGPDPLLPSSFMEMAAFYRADPDTVEIASAVRVVAKANDGFLLFPAGDLVLTERPVIEWQPDQLATAHEIAVINLAGRELWKQRIEDNEMGRLPYPADAPILAPGRYRVRLRSFRPFGHEERIAHSTTCAFRVAEEATARSIQRELEAARPRDKQTPTTPYIVLCLRYNQLREAEAYVGRSIGIRLAQRDRVIPAHSLLRNRIAARRSAVTEHFREP